MELITPGTGLLFWMVLSFGIVLILLKKLAWKPILGALREREDTIEGALLSARKTREEMGRMKADQEEIIRKARAERDILLKEARDLKEKAIAEAREKAGQETQKMIEAARLSIENEKALAIDEIRQQITILSLDMAEKILRQKLSDRKEQARLINDMLGEVKMN